MSAKPLTRLMQQAFDKLADEWRPFPHGVYCKTLDAMVKRGVLEERHAKLESGAVRWEYRRAANATGSES
jgi:hypothetical protein